MVCRGVDVYYDGEQAISNVNIDEVKDRLDQPGTGLSGGQQQRLCIARTIAVAPEVILMDEPCSAVDPIATAKIEELIDEMRENYAIAIVTHSRCSKARVSLSEPPIFTSASERPSTVPRCVIS